MELKDLKVESASVRVSNANEEGAVYNISASFATRDGVLTRVDSGSVMKGNEREADFWSNVEGQPSTTITYYGAAHDDVAMQTEINTLINQFIDLAVAKAQSEATE